MKIVEAIRFVVSQILKGGAFIRLGNSWLTARRGKWKMKGSCLQFLWNIVGMWIHRSIILNLIILNNALFNKINPTKLITRFWLIWFIIGISNVCIRKSQLLMLYQSSTSKEIVKIYLCNVLSWFLSLSL